MLGEDGKDPYLKAAAFPIADNPYSYGRNNISSLLFNGLRSLLCAYMEDDELWRAICSIRTNVRSEPRSPLKSAAKIQGDGHGRQGTFL